MLRRITGADIEALFKPLEETGKVARYPLTNIAETAEGNLLIEIAVAGFGKEDIEIEVVGNELHIHGTQSDNNVENVTYYQKHISTNDFTREIVLDNKFVGGNIKATNSNGILYIIIEPKEQKRNIVEIQ